MVMEWKTVKTAYGFSQALLYEFEKACCRDTVLFQFIHDPRFGLPHFGTVVVFNIVVSSKMEHAVDGVEKEFA